MKKAFAYLRVSGKSQVDGDGFPRQLEAIKGYAKAQNIRIAHVYEERGVSGAKDWEDRPAWMEMMAAMLANGVKTVIVEKLDRLARDLMVQETIIGDMRKRGLTLVSVHEPDLLQDDPTRTLLRQMMGAIAQYEKAMLVLKLRGARNRVKAAGGHGEGTRPFGSNAGEAETLARMLALAADHTNNWTKVAAQLDAEGRAPRAGGTWHPYAVSRIVKRHIQANVKTGKAK
jgi:DNA invertase Pin-like site-specific DNA recombinase